MDNKNLTQIVKAYLKPARPLLKLSRHHRRLFYARVEMYTREYLKEYPNATTDDIQKLLGSPKGIATDFKNDIGPDAIHKAYKRSKWITIGVCSAIIAALLVGTYFGYRYMKSLQTMVVVENPTVIYKN